MYRIINGRGTGKTLQLMLLAKENNGIIVCRNPRALEEKALRYGIVGIKFIGYNEFNKEDTAEQKEKFYVDEIEDFFKYYFYNYQLDGYTLSEE